MEIDRLSALPEHLLVDILGRLGDTKEAVKADILSKQWRFLWTNLPSITLENFSYDDGEIQRFAAGVHAVAARTKPPLQKLTVHLHYDERFASNVDACLESAAKSDVKHLDLCLRPIHYDPPLPNSNRYALPRAIYSHSSLTTLDLSHCNVAPPPAVAVEWRSMTDLSIYCTELTQRAIDGIASGCPVLRRLKLVSCSGFDRLVIGGRSFRYLKVCGCFDYGDLSSESQLLEISAPYMRVLDLIFLDPRRVKVRLADISSLEKARIEFDNLVWAPNAGPLSDEDMLTHTRKLFDELRRVRSLTLGPDRLNVLSMMMGMRWRFPTSWVKELEINHSRNEDNVYTDLAMLESSPCLEELIISNFISSRECRKWDPNVRADLNGNLSRLKNVRIKITVNPKFCGELSFTLALILLRRAPILEKMSIRIRSLIYLPVSNELVRKFETLLTYPRSSRKAAVEVCF